jgi:hypothetical protein
MRCSRVTVPSYPNHEEKGIGSESSIHLPGGERQGAGVCSPLPPSRVIRALGPGIPRNVLNWRHPNDPFNESNPQHPWNPIKRVNQAVLVQLLRPLLNRSQRRFPLHPSQAASSCSARAIGCIGT